MQARLSSEKSFRVVKRDLHNEDGFIGAVEQNGVNSLRYGRMSKSSALSYCLHDVAGQQYACCWYHYDKIFIREIRSGQLLLIYARWL